MPDGPIPDDLRDFILRYFDSIAQLEALLLLRANTHDHWRVSEVAKRLYTSEQEAEYVLARLCEDGLLGCQDDVYRYGGNDLAQQRMVDRLAHAYATQLIPVTKMIHAKPHRIREFANAFRLRKGR